MHAIKRRLTAFAAAAFLAGTLSVIPGSAQQDVEVGGEVGGDCQWKTRWIDAHGKCTGCCDATKESCPCTT
jgi:hypothetical protein